MARTLPHRNGLQLPVPNGYAQSCGTLSLSPRDNVTRTSQIGIMEKKMETTIVYGDYIGIMENEMEATIV